MRQDVDSHQGPEVVRDARGVSEHSAQVAATEMGRRVMGGGE